MVWVYGWMRGGVTWGGECVRRREGVVPPVGLGGRVVPWVFVLEERMRG